MAFADPQTIQAHTLPRTSSSANAGEFTIADGTEKLTVSHQYGKRVRRQIKWTHKKTVTDPLIPAQSKVVSMTTYLVVDAPTDGYTVAELKTQIDGLVAYLTASTGARVTQLLGGEN